MFKFAILIVTALTALPAWAEDASEYDAVRSGSGAFVRDNRGNCVRSKWMVGNDPCRVVQATVAVPVPIPAAPPPPSTIIQSEARTVYFSFNSARLNVDAKNKLNYLSQVLSGAKDVESARIVGYADRMGTASYNQALSERRAKAVKNYLARQGYLNTSIAEVRGVGKKYSGTPCSVSASRQEAIACLSPDRKVEVEVVYDVEAN